MDPNNGRIKWGFQYTPNDPYDYDEISEHQIIDATVNGHMLDDDVMTLAMDGQVIHADGTLAFLRKAQAHYRGYAPFDGFCIWCAWVFVY